MYKLFPFVLFISSTSLIWVESIKTLDSVRLPYPEYLSSAYKERGSSASLQAVTKINIIGRKAEEEDAPEVKSGRGTGDDKSSSLYIQCNSDEDCSDPNSICEPADLTTKCICNEFYEEKSRSPFSSISFIECTRRTCKSTRDCSETAYCGVDRICWPKCSDDMECSEGENCEIASGICSRKCAFDTDCFDSRVSFCDASSGICRFKCDPENEPGCQAIPVLCDSIGCHSRCGRNQTVKSMNIVRQRQIFAS
jgi:hypothetical protein